PLLCLHSDVVHRDLHSFPTRRSSDLSVSILLLQDDGHLELAAARGLPDYRIAEEIVQGLAYERLVGPLEGVRYRVITDTREDEADRKSTRLNSSHVKSSYAVFCLKKK